MAVVPNAGTNADHVSPTLPTLTHLWIQCARPLTLAAWWPLDISTNTRARDKLITYMNAIQNVTSDNETSKFYSGIENSKLGPAGFCDIRVKMSNYPERTSSHKCPAATLLRS